MSYGNEPTAKPRFQLGGRRAWPIAPVNRDGPNWRPEFEATVSFWLVCAPSSHPWWWWYVVSVIHLRQIPGTPPVHFQFPGATHEVLFLALSPEHPLPDVEDWKAMQYLTPPDLVHQVILPDDDGARELCELVVKGIVCLEMNPDVDNRSTWRSSLDQTAEHVRLGGHPG